MKMKRYRTVIVGSGKIGALFEAEPKREKPASHAGAVRANRRTELAAFVDVDAKNLSAARKMFPNTNGYASLAACLAEESPDIVIIATPSRTRLALIRECARFHVPIVICEKPLAASAKEAKQIGALVNKSSMTFVLNYHRRLSPLFACARATLQSGKLGRIQQATCYYSNGLYNNGGHTLDALTYLLDDEIVSVAAVKNTKNITVPAGDMNVDAFLTTKKGTIIALQSFDQKEYGIHDFRIYGTKGSLTITDYGVTLIEILARPSRFVGVRQLDAAHQRSVHIPLSATEGVLTYAIECYEKRRVPLSSVASGLSALQTLDALTGSAKRGGRKVAV